MTQLLFSLLFFLAPHLSFAAGLVPCGTGGPNDHPCQACDIVTLINSLIHWFIGILTTITVMMIVYAGIKLVTSGGNVGAKTAALSMFNNIIIGFVIIMSGWLIVDTIMKTLLNEDNYGVWNQIQCVKVIKLTNGSVDNACSMIPGETQLFDCSAQEATCTQGRGVTTIDRSQNPWKVTCVYHGGSRPPDLSAGGACNNDVVSPIFGGQTGNAQCVIKAESVCGGRNVSTTDVMDDGRAFSYGPMQINLTVHKLRGCAGYPTVLDCKSAFSGRNYTAHVTNESLYQKCAAAAQDIACNIKNGHDIFKNSGWGAWSTAASCGLK